VRELNVELASVQSQADKQQQNVSQTIFFEAMKQNNEENLLSHRLLTILFK
jgi:hypothetical protein